MLSQTRLYLRTNLNEHRRLAWFKNNKPNEMLVGIYGINGKNATLKYMWPEKVVEVDEIVSVRYNYKDAEELSCVVDHITCHADGTFHVKTKNHDVLYIQTIRRTTPLGADTPTFLDFHLISDAIGMYANISEPPKNPYVDFQVPDNHYIAFRGMFSGVNYNLTQDMLDTMVHHGNNFEGAHLISGTLQGMLAATANPLSPDLAEKRPRGTILSFRFPLANNRWLLKAFLFQ